MKHELILNNLKDTESFAAEIAGHLHGGEIIGLVGDLGAGKTIFTKALAKHLGVKEKITSPTFVFMKVYNIQVDKKPLELVHVDAYRLENVKELESIGLSDYLNRNDTIIVIEWADKIKNVLPKQIKYIYFSNIDENKRKISHDFTN